MLDSSVMALHSMNVKHFPMQVKTLSITLLIILFLNHWTVEREKQLSFLRGKKGVSEDT